MDFHDGCFCFKPTEQVEAARQDGLPVRCAPDLGMPCACTATMMLNDFPVQDDPLFDVAPSLDWNNSSPPHSLIPPATQLTSDPSKIKKRPASASEHSLRSVEPAAAEVTAPCCNCPCEKLHGYVVKRQKCCGETCQCIEGNCNCPEDPSGEKCCHEIDQFSDFLRNYGGSLVTNVSPPISDPVSEEEDKLLEVPLPTPTRKESTLFHPKSSCGVHISCGANRPAKEPPPVVEPDNTSVLRELTGSPAAVLLPVDRPAVTDDACDRTLYPLQLQQPQHPIMPIPLVPPPLQLGAPPINITLPHQTGTGTPLLPPSVYNIPTSAIPNTLSLHPILRIAPSTTSVTPGAPHSSTASFPASVNSHSLPVTTVFAMHNQFSSTCTNRKSKRTNISLTEKADVRDTSTPKPEMMQCTDCDASFATQDELESHAAKKHCKARPYACNQCSSTFLFKQNRDRHIVEVHHGKRPHKCPRRNCSAAFKNSSGLKQHMRTVHDKQRPFKCDQCNSSFGQRNHLTQHVLVVHEHRKLFQCDECGTSFSNRGNLNQHIRRRHSKSDTPTTTAKQKKSATAAKSK